MDEGSDSLPLLLLPTFISSNPFFPCEFVGVWSDQRLWNGEGGESKAVNNESERGYLESFKADPYEMFEQVARPLSRCRFTYRGKRPKRGKGGIETVTTRGTYCPFSFENLQFPPRDPVFRDTSSVGNRSRVNSINCSKRWFTITSLTLEIDNLWYRHHLGFIFSTKENLVKFNEIKKRGFDLKIILLWNESNKNGERWKSIKIRVFMEESRSTSLTRFHKSSMSPIFRFKVAQDSGRGKRVGG